jgi:hypothetical protein
VNAPIIDRFQGLYRELSADNLDLLDGVYSEDIAFTDPIHKVEGLASLKDYFRRMYENVAEIDFRFSDVCVADDRASLAWTMTLRHQRFRPREVLELPGASFIHFADRVHYHRDYFDLGAMIYERVPVLGTMVCAVKSRL